jgi:Na+/alanine symporter
MLLKALIGGLLLVVLSPVLIVGLVVAAIAAVVALAVPLLPLLFVVFLIWLLLRRPTSSTTAIAR